MESTSETVQSETDFDDSLPPDILRKAKEITMNLLPSKSKKEYVKEYNAFKEWRKKQKTTSFAEPLMQVYFESLSKKFKPPTLWSKYSKIASVARAYDNVDMTNYTKLKAFLKGLNSTHVPKQAMVFTPEEITKFCNEAQDNSYLDMKVRSITIVYGFFIHFSLFFWLCNSLICFYYDFVFNNFFTSCFILIFFIQRFIIYFVAPAPRPGAAPLDLLLPPSRSRPADINPMACFNQKYVLYCRLSLHLQFVEG